MCKTVPVVAGVLIAILALWPNLLSAMASKWILLVLAVVMIIHPFMCKVCGCACCEECKPEMPVKKGKKK
ncbi:MAG: hypothetical protein AABX11_04645 [Nanoarchaeota archaeon]